MPRTPEAGGYRVTTYRGKLCIYWREAGQPRRISLGTTDRAEADRQFAEFIAGLNAPPPQEELTVGRAIDHYLDQLSSPGTRTRQTYALAPIRERMGDVLVKRYEKANTDSYMEWSRKKRQHRLGRIGVRNGTILKELLALRRVFAVAVRDGLIDRAPYVHVPRSPRPLDRWLTPQEAARLLAEMEGTPHLWLFTEIALQTAARTSAILQLTWDRVDFKRGLIDFRLPEDGDADEEEQRRKGRAVVRMTDRMRAVLEPLRRDVGPVVCYHGKPVTSIKKAFQRAAKRAGFATSGRDRVTPHTLRHTAATWMAEADVPMRLISIYLGHSSEETTRRVYAHHSPSYGKRGAVALDAALKGVVPCSVNTK